MPETKPTTTEAEAFRAFAQKVVSVPKATVDQRAKAYEKSRKALRKSKAA